MISNMDLDQLITFERVVREGSFSRAGWALDVPQSTVSMRMRALERRLGGALVRRVGRRIELTDLGSSFLPYAERAIAILGEGIAATRLVASGGRGRVTVGVLGSLAGSLFGPVVAHYHTEHPEVEVVVRSGNHAPMIAFLRDGVVELALIAWPCTDALTTDFDVLLRLREPVVLAVGRQHPFARRHSIQQAEIAGAAHPFLLLRWWQTLHPEVARLAKQATSTVDVPMDVARRMLLEGAGIGFFTSMYISDALATGDVVAVPIVDAPPLWRESALVRLARSSTLGTAAQEFVVAVRERALQLQLLISDGE